MQRAITPDRESRVIPTAKTVAASRLKMCLMFILRNKERKAK